MTAPGKGARECRHCMHVLPHRGPLSLFGLLPTKWDLATCGRTMRPEPAHPGSTPDVIVVHRHPLVSVERALEFHACGPAARYYSAR
ncbi:hypothetical protein [Burkholderia stagnalis]|uniref:hypothetical protein n=1 Tax=Burkholderia stagnalis TaxID=1503054 RepID=UPI000759C684|nr:hypothetical protein [Burkholderia stagnalis]KVL84158.1 hypothetical protein WT03_02340 [Burkholderia stagnalis]KVL98382.1 hypothetical protein WT02_10110 [Burkholderia stagnalis]KVM16673.1 hypothetical protein WT04_03090 [Burkholderia stagnalis]